MSWSGRAGAGTAPTCFGKKATIVGNARANTIYGTSGPDVIVGLGGNDYIKGGGGADRICGGDGNDTVIGDEGLVGRPGPDLLSGDAGNDDLQGFKGNDRLVGGPGRDALDGGPGDDSADVPRIGVVGVGVTQFRARWLEKTYYELALDAVTAALRDARIGPDRVATVTYGIYNELFERQIMPDVYVHDYLGLRLKPSTRVTAGGGDGRGSHTNWHPRDPVG